MLFAPDRRSLRQVYRSAWRKARARAPLEPLEHLIVALLEDHPEYQPMLEADEGVLEAEYRPEDGASNPFLHLGLHLAIREQAATDRPPGITGILDALSRRLGDRHQAEHELLECLAATLWESQRQGVPPNEQAYLERIIAVCRRLGAM
jgi:hypothetical protein